MIEYRVIKSNRKTLGLQVKENGEVIVRAPHFCSKKRIEQFVNDNFDWILKAKKKQEINQNNKIELTPEEIQNLKELARQIIPERVSYYSQIMGLVPTGIKITSAQKRFGSCNSKNSLCFSYILMLYPPEAIDYVVVHELAHIKHHNHSKEFYDCVKTYLPDYKNREKALKSKQKLYRFI